MDESARTWCIRLLVLSYLFVLWVDQIAFAPIDKAAIRISDLLLVVTAVATPIAFPKAVVNVLRSQAALWCVALFASLIVSTLLSEGTLPAKPVGRLALQFALVVIFAVVSQKDAKWFGTFAYCGAATIIVISAAGYLLSLCLDFGEVAWAGYRPGFLTRDDHPLFGNWPRPVGGFSSAAEQFGFWAMVASAILFAGSAGLAHWHRLLVAASALIAAATLSVAASGGLLFVPLWLHYKGRRALAYCCGIPLTMLLIAGQLPIHVADLPRQLASPSDSIACLDHYPNHLARAKSADDCHLLPAWEGKVLTRYGLAKRHAFEVWREAPLVGAGLAVLSRTASEALAEDGVPIIWAYGSPHSAVFGTAAEQGIVGLLLFFGFALSLAKTLRGVRPAWRQQAFAPSLALTGFMAAALSQDAHKERLLWALCGYVIGLGLLQTEDKTTPGPTLPDQAP